LEKKPSKSLLFPYRSFTVPTLNRRSTRHGRFLSVEQRGTAVDDGYQESITLADTSAARFVSEQRHSELKPHSFARLSDI
jgi:hypothetical protein